MTTKTEYLFQELLALPDPDRWAVLVRVVDHFKGNSESEELHPEWEDEIARRKEDMESGRVKGIPASVVFAEIRRKLNLL